MVKFSSCLAVYFWDFIALRSNHITSGFILNFNVGSILVVKFGNAGNNVVNGLCFEVDLTPTLHTS